MPDKFDPKLKKRLTPATVRGISSTARSVGPAQLSGGFQGLTPAGVRLPAAVRLTQGYRPGHTALDLAGPAGTPVYAPQRMLVNQAGQGPWGINVIGTDPATGNRYTFGHFSAVAPGLVAGKVIPAGTLIGYEGSTFTAPGYSTGPHVHMQVNAPGGAALIPTSRDVLNTFVSGGKMPKATPAINTSLLVPSPAAARSQTSVGQVSGAMVGGSVAAGADKPLKAGSVQTTLQAPATSGGFGAGGSGSIVSGASFLASHKPLDYAMMGIGLVAVLFGMLLLSGQMLNKEYNRELDVINKTTATAGNVAGAFKKK
jgi:hypothetical protein